MLLLLYCILQGFQLRFQLESDSLRNVRQANPTTYGFYHYDKDHEEHTALNATKIHFNSRNIAVELHFHSLQKR